SPHAHHGGPPGLQMQVTAPLLAESLQKLRHRDQVVSHGFSGLAAGVPGTPHGSTFRVRPQPRPDLPQPSRPPYRVCAHDRNRKERPVDFQYTAEQEQFRQELRRWLAANLPPDLCVDDPTDERVAPDRATFERRVEWQRTMYKAGWVGISWPREYGGRGATLMEQLIYDEECFRARAPVLPGYSGIGMARPPPPEWGTAEQRGP